MSSAKAVITHRRNDYGFPVREEDHWETSYQRLVCDEQSASGLPATTAHKVSGAIVGLMFALGFIGWVWTIVLPA
jgi:hypothetical protein